MYTSEDIQAFLRQKPFRPLKIIASEGLEYEILHPDLVLVGRRYIQIGFADKQNPTVFDKLISVALTHIVGIQELPVEAKP